MSYQFALQKDEYSCSIIIAYQVDGRNIFSFEWFPEEPEAFHVENEDDYAKFEEMRGSCGNGAFEMTWKRVKNSINENQKLEVLFFSSKNGDGGGGTAISIFYFTEDEMKAMMRVFMQFTTSNDSDSEE